jgi:hypothetical protein
MNKSENALPAVGRLVFLKTAHGYTDPRPWRILSYSDYGITLIQRLNALHTVSRTITLREFRERSTLQTQTQRKF